MRITKISTWTRTEDSSVEEGISRVYVECEDTPFVVTMVIKTEGGFSIRLNDESLEKLDLTTLTIAKQNIPYVKVKKGKFTARLLSPAYYEFMKYADKDEKDSIWKSRVKNTTWRARSRISEKPRTPSPPTHW